MVSGPAQITFSQPALLLGLAVVVLPVLIHLLLRPRPRPTRFPALALLQRVLLTGQRANRLRDLALMAVRAGLLGLVALLLAAPTCRPAGDRQFFEPGRPTACAVILDDSASMAYRRDDTLTDFELCRAQALDFVAQLPGWPAGSVVAVVGLRHGATVGEFTADADTAAAGLRAAAVTPPHTRPLDLALQQAGDLLRSAGQPNKRIVVFTDGAAHAWENMAPAALAGIEDLAVRIVTPPASVRSNLGLLAATGPARLHVATSPVPIRATVAAEGLDGRCWLVVRQGERTLVRDGPLDIPAGTTREVALHIPPLPPGVHTVTVEIEPDDRLDFDRRRHVVFQTAEPSVVWLLAPTAEVTDDLSTLILHNLLAPATLTAEQQRVRLELVAGSAVPNPAAADGHAPPPLLIVVMSNVDLEARLLAALWEHVEAGATLVLVPRSTRGAHDWPELRQRFARQPPVLDELPAVSVLQWEPTSPFNDDADLAELTRCAVRRRLLLPDLAEGVQVEARYTDGEPALLAQRSGRGRALLLTTAPDPAWSDLGIRAAGLLIWLHRLVDEGRGPPTRTAAFTLGETTRQRFAEFPASGWVRVIAPGETDAPPAWTRLADAEPVNPWPTDEVGAYTLLISDSEERSAVYVANPSPAESRLARAGAAELRRALGVARVEVQASEDWQGERPTSLWRRLSAGSDPRVPLSAVLVLVCVLELWLARRRGRSAGRPAGSPE
jgi:hypothetical protein